MKKTFCIFVLTLSLTLTVHSSPIPTIQSFIEADRNSITPDGKIQGKMTINGQTYTAICDCNPVTPFSTPTTTSSSCDPSKLSIHEERKSPVTPPLYTKSKLSNLIGQIEDLSYVHIPYTSFKCLDGRHNKPTLSTPGGDAGEFINALSVYEDLLINNSTKLTQGQVDIFLSEYLKQMKPNTFHMCTDDEAVSHLEKELHIEGFNIFHPRIQSIPQLYDLIIKPENVGDLHLKMMLKYPEQFAVRKEIVEMFIRSYYKILWDKRNDLHMKLDLDVLVGEHNEVAFVEVRSEKGCQEEGLAPLMRSMNEDGSVFVNYLDAVSVVRKDIAKFFGDKMNHGLDSVDKDVMFKRMEHHGYVMLEITGGLIARDLPFYTIELA